MGNKSLPFLGPTSLSISGTNDAMDGNLVVQEQMEVNLEVVVELASYGPFDMKVCQSRHMEGENTLRPLLHFKKANLKVEILNFFKKTLQKGLGTMQATLHEVELEHNVLQKQLNMTKIRIQVLKHEATHNIMFNNGRLITMSQPSQ